MPGRGDFVRIADAVRRAPPGARILILPGHYRESVVIDKPLELVGEGPIEDVVLECSADDTVAFDTNIGVLRRLTLRQSGEKDYCVWIKQGRLELEDFVISSRGSACAAVSGTADPRLRRNRIKDGKQSGIFVLGTARGTYEGNEIVGNA